MSIPRGLFGALDGLPLPLELQVERLLALNVLQVETIPVCVTRADSEPESEGKVHPEPLSEFPGDWSDGHRLRQRWWSNVKRVKQRPNKR